MSQRSAALHLADGLGQHGGAGPGPAPGSAGIHSVQPPLARRPRTSTWPSSRDRSSHPGGRDLGGRAVERAAGQDEQAGRHDRGRVGRGLGRGLGVTGGSSVGGGRVEPGLPAVDDDSAALPAPSSGCHWADGAADAGVPIAAHRALAAATGRLREAPPALCFACSLPPRSVSGAGAPCFV